MLDFLKELILDLAGLLARKWYQFKCFRQRDLAYYKSLRIQPYSIIAIEFLFHVLIFALLAIIISYTSFAWVCRSCPTADWKYDLHITLFFGGGFGTIFLTYKVVKKYKILAYQLLQMAEDYAMFFTWGVYVKAVHLFRQALIIVFLVGIVYALVLAYQHGVGFVFIKILTALIRNGS